MVTSCCDLEGMSLQAFEPFVGPWNCQSPDGGLPVP